MSNIKNYFLYLSIALAGTLLGCSTTPISVENPTLESEAKITDKGLYFDGKKVNRKQLSDNGTAKYDYFFGSRIAPHGDSVKKYKEFVFLTWYQGGKDNRHVMLTRYNTKTGSIKTIQFPHRHTGFNNKWWIGESHNTIAVGISPINGSIHLLYDMHAYRPNKPADGSLKDDYFRYSFSMPNAVSVPDSEFTLAQFVQNKKGGYKHLTLTGEVNPRAYAGLTYPTFFLNENNELLMYMRQGGNNNGGYKFAKYLAEKNTWTDFTLFNTIDAKKHGNAYNWGLYGKMKYVNGKLRVGFQQRANIQDDKYKYQNGIYYAYSDNQDGSNDWKDHAGTPFDIPLVNSDKIKIFEPGDLIAEQGISQVHIVQKFDWTVTARGDVHFISYVSNIAKTEKENVHTYKPYNSDKFITSTDFSGATNIYTAGDNIYIIGLDKGRPYIEKALGGTNNFERVYHATSGKRFRHGNVYIHEGKLYYYLMELKKGTTQPIYLQVIDLKLPKT